MRFLKIDIYLKKYIKLQNLNRDISKNFKFFKFLY